MLRANWQVGYGALATNPNSIDAVIRYIENQEIITGWLCFKMSVANCAPRPMFNWMKSSRGIDQKVQVRASLALCWLVGLRLA
jgi:hypothetical protein